MQEMQEDCLIQGGLETRLDTIVTPVPLPVPISSEKLCEESWGCSSWESPCLVCTRPWLLSSAP